MIYLRQTLLLPCNPPTQDDIHALEQHLRELEWISGPSETAVALHEAYRQQLLALRALMPRSKRGRPRELSQELFLVLLGDACRKLSVRGTIAQSAIAKELLMHETQFKRYLRAYNVDYQALRRQYQRRD